MQILLSFFNDTATTEIYTLSLHDALPISQCAYCPTQNHVDEYGMRDGKVLDSQQPYLNRDYRFYANVLFDGTTFREKPMNLHYTIDAKGKEVAEDGLTKDRKSTRLNSSHANISYAVFCLKKKKNKHDQDE